MRRNIVGLTHDIDVHHWTLRSASMALSIHSGGLTRNGGGGFHR